MLHCDVMLLASVLSDSTFLNAADAHPSLYARVIGIYHANVIYTGIGMRDYKPMHFNFLHVCWLQLDPDWIQCSDWTSLCLNRLSFPPMANVGSFSLVDPSLVLQSCHLIPAFSLGKRHLDGVGLSGMSKDRDEWRGYYVNRSNIFP